MLNSLRPGFAKALKPVADLLFRMRVAANWVTVVGAIGVVVAALTLLPAGNFLAAAAVLAFFALFDGVDGVLARLTGGGSSFGAFLDSTLDRVADAAIYVGLVWWFAGRDQIGMGLALLCLVAGFWVSYARARAEGFGWQASQGPAERADRLVLTLLGVLAVGLGAPIEALWGALGLVAALSLVTLWRRGAAAYVQARESY